MTLADDRVDSSIVIAESLATALSQFTDRFGTFGHDQETAWYLLWLFWQTPLLKHSNQISVGPLTVFSALHYCHMGWHWLIVTFLVLFGENQIQRGANRHMVPKVCHQIHYRPSLSRASGSRYWSLLDLFSQVLCHSTATFFFSWEPTRIISITDSFLENAQKRHLDILCNVFMIAIFLYIFSWMLCRTGCPKKWLIEKNINKIDCCGA